ncbi:hypothetical protein DIPPA_03878 [Diplonema papillatum]|nr:hypothetical protein DIPPA_22824 [Diplonema papillatum]KAJ9444464.1 hypothetical protein DIPPA_21456 [Diplonema papillatum]KAJ9444682.1 hypothetical protein DIPPA_11060 [Diplonema papillatum]KAJ9453167.1 hypothetical protein DIPPA_30664 [Diplonema papillatum]KAJ9454339.1 hypothetical protein DIPPA_10621 [Diplonema papillatum]
MLSVVSRAHRYAVEARRFYPALSDEEAFLMWVNRKMMAGELTAESALQYATYFRMSRVDWMGAYRRSVKLTMEQFEGRRTRDAGRTPTKAAIQLVVSRGSSLHAMALRFQWSTACRFVDLQRIRLDHMWSVDTGQVMILFVGGKTDPTSRGQGLLLPRSGPFLTPFWEWITIHRPALGTKAPLFPNLSRQAYNSFLQEELGVSSHRIRHAALSWVALLEGEQTAMNVGRHLNPRTTRLYTPHHLWQPVLLSAPGTAALQRTG